MTYYDQLGLLPTARDEEIRKAHRILCKLLHPDQQTDPALRSAAEVQMRRVNTVVDVLLDPERRRQYDQSLMPPAPIPRPEFVRGRFRFEGSSLALLSTILAAVLLSFAAVWLYAGDLLYFQTSAAPPPLAAASRPHPALPMVQATAAPLPATPAPSLDGLWIYASAVVSPPQPKMVVDAAERVELRLESRGDTLNGKYTALYRVPDHTVSPRIMFSFQGPCDPEGEFPWRTADGTRGLIDLKLVNDNSMRVDWRVVRFGSHIALGAGAAILTRVQ